MDIVAQFRSFNYPSRVLMVNQFGINVGFYMLLPYLAGYLAGPLGLAAWAVGLVLGVRNFAQQGMFFVGGTLADRFGYKPLIVAGCLVRTGGFVLLVLAQSLPGVLISSAAMGFAGALFNPAARAYLAADASNRRIEAFSLFNVFYQSGILLGPLVGLALVAMDFRISVMVAAVVFAALSIVQLLALPADQVDRTVPKSARAAKGSVIQDWRIVLGNRAVLWFAAAMIGAYVLEFQINLALPLHASRLAPHAQTSLVAVLFLISSLVTVAGQRHITRWFGSRWEAGRSLPIGVMLLTASFVPLAIVPNAQRFGTAIAVLALLLSASLLALAAAVVFPFELDRVVSLSGDRLIATHYGFYKTVVGVGLLVGNLAIGALLGVAHRLNVDEFAWGALILVGLVAVAGLLRHGRQIAPPADPLRACANRSPVLGRRPSTKLFAA
ncbi:MFS transporter [Mycobacterium kansasii]|uniref:Multidrug resistance protein MdtH n=1 Tax=Mycobacterium attenuatum TaxID=2341086 RepID=A0A498PM83_9MYCO|nr:MFS transporter [Mycobacterium attenuatum]ORB84922.1 MFS transporter [Mycobacterium kansasii]VBA31875.1 Multidrug resistance protein MdtH [Mycobacterium attenuatum]VBA45686.1 Multidrug resistance protein MdtH [Mycobacterium attenuatum]